MTKNKLKKAFTLIELLAVIAIIGILATLATISLDNAKTKTKDTKKMNDLKLVSDAIERYNIDRNEYPIVGESIDSCGEDGVIAYKPSTGQKPVDRLCSDYGFRYGDTVYIDKIPRPTESTLYTYKNYTPPCVYSSALEAFDGKIFWCQGGSCHLDTGLNCVAN